MSDDEIWFDSVWESLDRPWLSTWFDHQAWPPRLYHYHYGRADGLLSILATQCPRATDAHYLNDAAELRYTRDVIGRTVAELTSEATATTPLAQPFLAGLVSDTDGLDRPAVCTVSFSDEGDILSQWRAYAGTTGYALGLATEWWPRPAVPEQMAARQAAPVLRLRKVLYRQDEQHRMVRSLLAQRTKNLTALAVRSVNRCRRRCALTPVLAHAPPRAAPRRCPAPAPGPAGPPAAARSDPPRAAARHLASPARRARP